MKPKIPIEVHFEVITVWSFNPLYSFSWGRGTLIEFLNLFLGGESINKMLSLPLFLKISDSIFIIRVSHFTIFTLKSYQICVLKCLSHINKHVSWEKNFAIKQWFYIKKENAKHQKYKQRTQTTPGNCQEMNGGIILIQFG